MKVIDILKLRQTQFPSSYLATLTEEELIKLAQELEENGNRRTG